MDLKAKRKHMKLRGESSDTGGIGVERIRVDLIKIYYMHARNSE